MSYAGAVIDLDGTVYVGEQLVEGVPAATQCFRDAGLDLLFFSNNPVRDGKEYVEHLQEYGLDVFQGEAASSADVTRAHLRTHHEDETILPIASDPLQNQLETAGVDLTDDPGACDVLLASWTAGFDFDDMDLALAALDEETAFYGTDPDRTFQVTGGDTVPGSGAIVGAIESTVGRDADAILGKPAPTTREFVREQLDHDLRDCLMVGDRIDTDIRMGEAAGMTTVLVLTGVTDRKEVATSPVEPDYIIEDLGEIEQILTSC